MKDKSSPQTLPSFCINWTTVLIAGLAAGRDKMKSSIAFMLLWNEYLFNCLDDPLLFLIEPVFIFIYIGTFVICNWTCILPSIGEKRRRQGQWMRLSQWDNNLQPGKPFKTTIIIIITITITITIITITIIIINDYQSGTTICNLHNYWKLTQGQHWHCNGHPFAKTTSIIRLINTNSTCIHSNARLESVCHSLPERNSQDAASDAQRL